jgi:hypothetical protein
MTALGLSRVRTGAVPALAGLLVMYLMPSAAFAESVPPSQAYEAVTDLATSQTLADNRTSGCATASGAIGCAGGGFDPDVFAADLNSNVDGAGEAFFNFEVLGPPQVIVPLLIEGYASGLGGHYIGLIDVGLYSFPDSFTTVFQFQYPTPQLGGFTVHAKTVSGDVSQMIVGVGCSRPAPSSECTAHIDPTIHIDPTFPEASQFELLESPVGAAIPEPSTWAMTLLGFAGLAFAGYRARVGPASAKKVT